MIRTPAEKGKTNLQYKEYQKESKKLLDFCEKMMGKREKEADSIELEQPEGVPKVREISKEKLNGKLNEIIDQPQYVGPIGENTLPRYYSREMSRYEPPNPIKQKEREDLLEKVREMTSEESKGGKGEKLVEVDTDLSWNHEGLRPLPKSHKDRLNGSPKSPRVPKVPKVGGSNKGTSKKECPSFRGDYNEEKCPELILKENEVGMVVPQEEKQVPEIDKKSDKNNERWDFESPGNLADKKTARWIEEQNEFLGKQEEKEFQENRKERDPSVFEPNGPIKVLQKQRANPHTRYEQIPQYLMGAQKGQTPHLPSVVTNKGDVSWRGQGKRYPFKEKEELNGVDMGSNMVQEVKEKVTRLMEPMELKPRVVILLMSHKDRVVISQLKVLGMDKVEMGKMKIEMIKRNTGILGLVLKMIVMKRVIWRILMNWR